MHPELSFEQAPPLFVPYRFFLTAPWFGVAAGLLLACRGEAVFASRWSLEALAATHLLTTGFMLQAMCGALLQFVPVAAGGNVWRPRLVAGIIHPLLVLAAIALAVAFLDYRPALFMLAALLFLPAIGLFAAVVGVALWHSPARGPTMLALRLALVGLAMTLAFGVILAAGMARGSAWPLPVLTDIHAAWGLGGWGLMLLVGVAYYVVPMFQLTPAYPPRFARILPWLLLAVLLAWTFVLLAQPRGVSESARAGLFLTGLGLGTAFAATTLHLQMRRRRKLSDTTLRFFRLAMASLLGLLASTLLMNLLPALGEDARAAPWLGLLALVGVFVSAISGMLYKIVPFIHWLHLQRICPPGVMPPPMNRMIAEQAMRRQFHMHLLALLLLLASVWLAVLAPVAGMAFAASCLWLGINLMGAARAATAFRRELAGKSAAA